MYFHCIKEFFSSKGTKYTETEGVVIQVNIDDKITWDFDSGNNFVAFDGGVEYIVGKWQCDGRDGNFIITGDVTKRDGTRKNQTYSSRTPDRWADTVQKGQLDSFICVTNALSQYIILSNIDGVNFQIKDNLYVVGALTPSTNWFFYQPKQGTKTWVEVSNKTITSQGTWECFGREKFKITRSDGKTYTAGKQEWEEPTASEATTEPKADDSFPLKLRSEGPNVVKLQKFLNNKIPGNPLTVNGVFDQKTADKLIEFQKKEGIIK